MTSRRRRLVGVSVDKLANVCAVTAVCTVAVTAAVQVSQGPVAGTWRSRGHGVLEKSDQLEAEEPGRRGRVEVLSIDSLAGKPAQPDSCCDPWTPHAGVLPTTLSQLLGGPRDAGGGSLPLWPPSRGLFATSLPRSDCHR